jgi:hypothetical protein
MAAAWCMLKKDKDALLAAFLDGTLDRRALATMSSEDRRAAFAKIIGDDNAREVNASFERTMLLKNQKAGMMNWLKKQTTISDPVRRDIAAQINKLDRVLSPAEGQSFASDLAAKKLGVTVTADEARDIFALSQKAERARADAKMNPGAPAWTAYGRAQLDLRDKIESLKPDGATLGHQIINILNFPKSALTSVLHWSAPFVQGWGMISTKQWWTGVGQMFQYFSSEEKYRDLEGYMLGHPDYDMLRDAKLGLTHISDRLSTREEAIQSSLLEGANEWLSERTGVPNLIRAWSRSFTGFLNYVRFNRATQLLDAARAMGEDVSLGSKTVKDIASVVNNFTGRGALGTDDRLASIGPVLNTMFFSPRKIVATVEMFNPVMYARLSPVARQAAIRQLAGSLIATGAVMTLAKVSGAEVNFDPRSSDFGKIGIAGQKFDMTGGNASYLRMLARVATGQAMSHNGNISDTVGVRGHDLPTRAGTAANFMLGKLAPVAATLADLLFGKNAMGAPFNITDTMREELTPIVINSFIQDAGNNPDWYVSAIPALTALLGVGLESPEPPMSVSGRDVFGDRIPGVNAAFGTSPGSFGTPGTYYTDPVVKEAREAGAYLSPVSDKIRGVQLSDQQLDDYARIAGRLAHERLGQVIAQPNWQAASTATKRATMQHVINTQREAARATIIMQSQGSSNDIAAKARDAKKAKAPLLEPAG